MSENRPLEQLNQEIEYYKALLNKSTNTMRYRDIKKHLDKLYKLRADYKKLKGGK